MVGELRSGAEPPRGANLHIPKTRRPSLSATAGLPDGRLAQALRKPLLWPRSRTHGWRQRRAVAMTISSSSHEPRSLSPSPLRALPLPLMPPLRPPALLLHFLPGAADRVVVGAANMAGVVGVVGVVGVEAGGRGGVRCPRARRQLLPQWPLPHRHCSSSRAAALSAAAAAAAAAVAAAAAAVVAAAEAAAEAAPRLRTYITAAPTAIGANTPDAGGVAPWTMDARLAFARAQDCGPKHVSNGK